MIRGLRAFLRHIIIALTVSLMAACSSPAVQETAVYDLGLLHVSPTPAAPLPPLIVADVSAPAWLDGTGMVYRMAYANAQQVRTYAYSRWVMPPARLFEQRLKTLLAQRGEAVLGVTDGASNLPLLTVELVEFSQVFGSAAESRARVTVRAAILRGRTLVAQKSFSHEMPSATADAHGGAAAMARASDAMIGDMAVWLASHLPK